MPPVLHSEKDLRSLSDTGALVTESSVHCKTRADTKRSPGYGMSVCPLDE